MMSGRCFVAACLALGACCAGVAAEPESDKLPQLLYLVSQQGASIDVYTIDADSGELELLHEIALPGNGGPLTTSPNERLVYVAMTMPPVDGERRPAVATLRRERNGSLTLMKTAALPFVTPYIRTDPAGSFLLAAHYGVGRVTVLRIEDGVCTDKLVDDEVTAKNAHCVEFDPTGEFVFVPHTGPNRVYQFRFDAKTGQLTPNDPPFVAGPDAAHHDHEPRHIVFHPKLDIAYTSNEKRGGITAWRFDRERGTLELMQTLTTLPPEFEGRSAAADIHLTPDGRFAYVSNRDLTQSPDAREGGDTSAAFSLDPKTGRMTSIGQFPTEHFPRTFAIDRTGRFLYAAGQRSDRLTSYRIDAATGRLERLKTYDVDEGPIWAECLPGE
ncbi:MAG: lactonase family protein [Planctomycetaceae bacterium]